MVGDSAGHRASAKPATEGDRNGPLFIIRPEDATPASFKRDPQIGLDRAGRRAAAELMYDVQAKQAVVRAERLQTAGQAC